MRKLVSLFIWVTGMLYFVFFLLFTLACTYIFPERIYLPWFKKMMRFLFMVIFTKVEKEGLHHVKPGKIYLFMANHVSLFDLPLLAGYVPGNARGLEAHNHHHWPLYGWVTRRVGNIPLERESAHSSLASFRKAILLLKNGQSMIILPEGHRTLDGRIQPFKKLPFLLAKQAGTAIIPIGLSGMYSLKRKGNWMIRPGKVKIAFGEEITKEEISNLSINDLKDLVQRKISELVERP